MKRSFAVILVLACCLSGCMGSTVPKDALQLAPESLADRQVQTRRFETANYETMLGAASAVFQDLGFTLEESEFTLGVLVGSKERDATDAGQVAGAIFLAAMFGVQTSFDSDQTIRASMVMREIESADEKKAAQQKLTPETLKVVQRDVTAAVAAGLQKHFPNEISARIAEQIGASTAKTLTSDLARLMSTRDSGQCTVRVTFQRVIYNTQRQVTRREQINDPVLYQQFFDKLSQAVFLEAHDI